MYEDHETPAPGSRQRILLIRLSHLGDVLHALPVFHALRAAAPEAELAWAIQPEFAELVRPLPGLARTILFERRGGPGAWIRLRRALAEFGADWSVDAQGNLKSAAVMLFSGARRRTGFHRRDWREGLGALVMNDPATRVADGAGDPPHALDRALHFARHVAGVGPDWRPGGDWLRLSEGERDAGREEWKRRMARDGLDEAVIVQLAAAGDVRAWPLDHQRELLSRLQLAGRPLLVLSGPAEADAGRWMAAQVEGRSVSHWIGQRGLRELAAVFRAAAERGAHFVGGDSGPMHLAVTCGLRVVALAGPQDPRRTGPWAGARAAQAPALESEPGPYRGGHLVLRGDPLPDCVPCLARNCRLHEGPICMQRIAPERVLQALSEG